MHKISKTIIYAGILCVAGTTSFAAVIQNFDSGNISLGNSALTYGGNAGPSAGCASNSALYGEGTYAVTSSASSCHSLWAPTGPQSSPYFMAVNGSSLASQANIYSQTVATGIIAGQTFNFSGFFSGLYSVGAANLVLKVYDGTGTSGTLLGSSAFTTNLATPAGSNPAQFPASWVQQSVSFTALSNTVTVQVFSASTIAGGNDFGLDTLAIVQTSNGSTSATPEPASFFLAGSALLGLAMIRRK